MARRLWSQLAHASIVIDACEMRQGRLPNDCRISCNAASHATETAARFLRRLENGFAESAPPRSADCDSRPLGRRANKRRVVSFLQGLAGESERRPEQYRCRRRKGAKNRESKEWRVGAQV